MYVDFVRSEFVFDEAGWERRDVGDGLGLEVGNGFGMRSDG